MYKSNIFTLIQHYKMINVLWFAPTPCGSVRRNNAKIKSSGGWLISLEDELKYRNDVDLHVAFFSNSESQDFKFDRVSYHPIPIKMAKGRINRLLHQYWPMSIVDRNLRPLMLDIVKKVNPNLIHIHGTEERFGMIQENIIDIPICFSIQGIIEIIGKKYFSGIPKAEIAKYDTWKDRLWRVSFLDGYQNIIYRGKRENTFLPNAQYILGRTFWDRDVTLAMNPQRKYYVADEVMRKPFYEKVWRKESWSKCKIKIISTLSSGIYKGFEVALETAKILKYNSKLDFEWLIAGYEKDAKIVYVSSRITGLTPDKLGIKFLGRLDAEQLSEQLANSDIFVHVSHIENSPNSVCEAMLVGIPIIASFTGGTSSILQNGKEGILVQDGDPYVLAGAIVDMFQHFKMAKNFGIEARKRALPRHNPKRIADELFVTYTKILEDFSEKKKHK